MRTSLLLAGVAAGLVVAQPHVHAHRRSHMHHNHGLDKRAVVEEVVTVTVLECVLEGRQLSEPECNQGIQNGTLRFTDGDSGAVEAVATNLIVQPQPTPAPAVHAELPPVVEAPAPAPAPAPVEEAPAPAPAAPAPPPAPAPEAPAPPPPPPAAAPEPAAPAVPANNRAHGGGFSFGTHGNVGASFPSGQISCDQFPSSFGAVPARWLGLGGWLSVQKPGGLHKRAGGFSNIMTVVPDQCRDGSCCVEGGYCSYACPNGFFKAQWPSTQGSTGQSVGGLLCQNGKLVLTNPNSDRLCVSSSQQVTASVKNTMDQGVSICRTNYPGDESMTIPIYVPPGETVALPVLDMPSYWRTQDGSMTSAQYYVNPAGVSPEEACQWKGTNTGNWAPMVIGAGFNGNEAFISLFGNAPTQTREILDYKIKLEGQISLPCRYQHGQICSGHGYTQCSNPLQLGSGCTTAVRPGNSMTFVLSR